MKKQIIAGLALVILMLAASVSAQIYKYIDEDGRKRWTDDLSQVPVEQRASAERFEDIQDTPQESAANQMQSKAGVRPDTNSSEAQGELTRDSLMEEKSNLESQYQMLMQERKQLETMTSGKGDDIDRADLVKRISAFNAKIEQYETQLDAYKKRIEVYKKKGQDHPSPTTPETP